MPAAAVVFPIVCSIALSLSLRSLLLLPADLAPVGFLIEGTRCFFVCVMRAMKLNLKPFKPSLPTAS